MTEVIAGLITPIIFLFVMVLVASTVLYAVTTALKLVRAAVEFAIRGQL